MGKYEAKTLVTIWKNFEEINFGKKTFEKKETIKVELSLSLIFKIQNIEIKLSKNY